MRDEKTVSDIMSESFRSASDERRQRRISGDLTASDLADFKPLHVNVHVYNAATDGLERSKAIDFNNFEEREWFLRTLAWAIMNGKEICVINQRDDI